MSQTIEFYFDFSSPYGYLASCRAEEIENATGYQLSWNPYLMGAVFKQTGRQPLVSYPLVSEYAITDIKRSARKLGAPLSMPEKFPIMTASACRACYWAEEQQPGITGDLSKAFYRAYFVEGKDISKSDVVLAVIDGIGLDQRAASAALNSPQLKEHARTKTNAIIDKGIFGSPFFVINNEPFWGNDRVDDLILWCRKGGW